MNNNNKRMNGFTIFLHVSLPPRRSFTKLIDCQTIVAGTTREDEGIPNANCSPGVLTIVLCTCVGGWVKVLTISWFRYRFRIVHPSPVRTHGLTGTHTLPSSPFLLPGLVDIHPDCRPLPDTRINIIVNRKCKEGIGQTGLDGCEMCIFFFFFLRVRITCISSCFVFFPPLSFSPSRRCRPIFRLRIGSDAKQDCIDLCLFIYFLDRQRNGERERDSRPSILVPGPAVIVVGVVVLLSLCSVADSIYLGSYKVSEHRFPAIQIRQQCRFFFSFSFHF